MPNGSFEEIGRKARFGGCLNQFDIGFFYGKKRHAIDHAIDLDLFNLFNLEAQVRRVFFHAGLKVLYNNADMFNF